MSRLATPQEWWEEGVRPRRPDAGLLVVTTLDLEITGHMCEGWRA